MKLPVIDKITIFYLLALSLSIRVYKNANASNYFIFAIYMHTIQFKFKELVFFPLTYEIMEVISFFILILRSIFIVVVFDLIN